MAGRRRPTRDHEEIRRWAARWNAVPAEVIPFRHDGEPALLRFMIGKVPESQEQFRAISWESFFAQFDVMNLALAHQDARSSDYELLQFEEKSGERPGDNFADPESFS